MLLDLIASSPSSEMSDEIGISHAIYSIHNWFHSDSNRLAICCRFEVEDITPYELINTVDGLEFLSLGSNPV